MNGRPKSTIHRAASFNKVQSRCFRSVLKLCGLMLILRSLNGFVQRTRMGNFTTETQRTPSQEEAERWGFRLGVNCGPASLRKVSLVAPVFLCTAPSSIPLRVLQSVKLLFSCEDFP